VHYCPYRLGKEAIVAYIAKHRWWWDAAGLLIAAAGMVVLVYAILFL
jgi:hypothetical protein